MTPDRNLIKGSLICLVLMGFGLVAEPLLSQEAVQELAVPISDMQTPGGDVLEMAWAPDGSHVVFLLDPDYSGIQELWSAAADGSARSLLGAGTFFKYLITEDSSSVVFRVRNDEVSTLWSLPIGGGLAIELSAPLPAGRSVDNFTITPDSQTVVFTSSPLALQVFSTPVGGGPLSPLDFGFAGTGRLLYEMWPTADNQRIIYTADLDEPFREGLYTAPLDGGPPTQLHVEISNVDWVTDVQITPDGAQVLFNQRLRTLYSVPADGSSPASVITELSVDGQISDDGQDLYYGRTVSGFEFMRQDIAGGTPEVITSSVFGTGGWRLAPISENIIARDGPHRQLRAITTATGENVPLTTGLPVDSAVGADFRFSGDESRAIFSVGPDPFGIGFRSGGEFDVYSSPVTGGTAVALNDLAEEPIALFRPAAQDRVVLMAPGRLASVPQEGGVESLLSAPVVPGGELFWFSLSPDRERVAYRGEQDSSGAIELFETGITGGPPTQLSPAPRVKVGEVESFEIGPNGLFAVYLADQELRGQDELWSVALPDGNPIRLNSTLPRDAFVRDFAFAAAGQRVIFSVDNQEEIELWSAPISGGGAVRLNPAELPLSLLPFSDPIRSPYLAVPGGQWAVFHSEPSLYRVPLTGGVATLLDEGNLEINSLGITPDGARVLYTTFEPTEDAGEVAGGNIVLLSVPLLGGPAMQLGTPAACDYRTFGFSPDGQWLATRCFRSGPDLLQIFRHATGLVLDTPTTADQDVQFAPDSSWAAFMSNSDLYSIVLEDGAQAALIEKDVDELAVAGLRLVVDRGERLEAMDFDGTDRVTLYESAEFPFVRDIVPSADGARLIFSIGTGFGLNPDLYRTSIHGGGPTLVSADVEFFALTPDGTQVVYATGDDLRIQPLLDSASQSLLPEEFAFELEGPLEFSAGQVFFRGRSHPELSELFASDMPHLLFDDFESGDLSAWSFFFP